MAERPPSVDAAAASDPADAPPIDLRRALLAFRRSRLIIVALVIVVTAVAVQVVSHADTRYRTTARLIEDTTAAAAPADGAAVDRELATARALATSRTVLDAVARRLPGQTAEGLGESVDARIAAPDDVLDITAAAGEAPAAARIANAVAAALIAERARVKHAAAVKTRVALSRTLRRMRRAGAAKSVLEALRVRLSAAVADEATTGDDLRLVAPAAVPASPYAPKPARTAALAGLSALLIGLLIALARDRMRPRTEDPEGLGRALALPLLAVFLAPSAATRAHRRVARARRWLVARLAPAGRRLAAAVAELLSRERPADQPERPSPLAAFAPLRGRLSSSVVAPVRARIGRPAEARAIIATHAQDALVTAVRRSLPATRRRQRVLLVCGIGRRSWATTVARSLADGLADDGLATLLVLADPRAARATDPGPGIARPDGLDVTAIGHPADADAALSNLRGYQYDYVVIAGPPLQDGVEVRTVARHVRAAIIVGRGERTTVGAAVHARRVLDALGLYGLGVVGMSDRPGAQPQDGALAAPALGRELEGAGTAPATPLQIARPRRSASDGQAKRSVAAAGRGVANND
jgi:capsular polysaccharide biosynthesis protein